MINNLIAYQGVVYIRDVTVTACISALLNCIALSLHRHAGDYGNHLEDGRGWVLDMFSDFVTSLSGDYNVIGKGIVVSANVIPNNISHRRGLIVSTHKNTLPKNNIGYKEVMMNAMASQINGVSIAYSTVSSGGDQIKHRRSASLAFVRGFHR